MDIMGPLPVSSRGNRYVVVIADYFTKWTEAFAIADMEAETVARVLVEEFICRFGVPEELHTDQGRQFESELFQHMCRLLDIHKTRTTPFHPQSDGMVERFNRTLEDMLSLVVSENQKDWDAWLPYLLMAYRSAEHESTGFSPAEIMLGRMVTLPLSAQLPRLPDETDSPPEFKCRDCKRRYSDLSELKRHYAEKHGDGRKLFRCEECDYSSNKKADVVRHKSSRHKSEDTRQVSLGLKEPNEPSTSKPRSPPRVQRPDWPTLQTIVGSPHSATEFQQENHLDEAIEQRDTPPTPVVTPLKEACLSRTTETRPARYKKGHRRCE
ncbi:hypothetical protein BSL78_04910 [Apostichopus japonicus]|uniref:Integrase catalytic domain-containing protein n=1 Tax=Stichopus japonicus TaxID=307972 RepID=A0A2G8LD25_STIJA|nr:hypothetical protein BSL78_04910 [Apostichopus japonicus]